MEKDEIVKFLSGSENIKKEQIIELLKKIRDPSDYEDSLTGKERISKLKSLNESYKNKINLKVGDIVQWKVGLKNKKMPDYNESCIVIEILDTPIMDKEAPLASPYYGEKLDLKLGIIADNGDFLTFHYDRNRFELTK